MSASIEWLCWNANEINRQMLENRIWCGSYHAAGNRTERLNDMRRLISSAVRHDPSLAPIVERCAAEHARLCHPAPLTGISVGIDD